MDHQTRIPLQNGTSIPCMGFGTWKTPAEQATAAVHAALAAGSRQIDPEPPAALSIPRPPTATSPTWGARSQPQACRAGRSF